MHRATPLNTSIRAYTAGGSRSVVDKVDDTKLMQEMGGNFMANETRDAIESAQNYGFSSVVFDSEKAVWVPFPFMWVVVALLGNLKPIARTLGLEGIVDAMVRSLSLLAGSILIAAGALVALTVVLFRRRRRFG